MEHMIGTSLSTIALLQYGLLSVPDLQGRPAAEAAVASLRNPRTLSVNFPS